MLPGVREFPKYLYRSIFRGRRPVRDRHLGERRKVEKFREVRCASSLKRLMRRGASQWVRREEIGLVREG